MKNLTRLALVILGSTLTAATAEAQIGSGWTRRTHSERLQYHHTGQSLQQISPAPSSYSDSWVSYSKSGETRTFRFKNFDAGRCEIRVNNDYTSGQRQFEGYVKFTLSNQASDYAQTTVMQDFGAATHAAWKATMRKDNTFRAEHGIVLASGIFGVRLRYNFIHNLNNATVQVYINGSKKLDRADEGGTSHYFKFGMYQGRCVATAVWDNVKYFSK